MLTLRPTLFFDKGPVLARQPIRYDVDGLPPGYAAHLTSQHGSRWDLKWSPPSGSFASLGIFDDPMDGLIELARVVAAHQRRP